MNSSDYSKMQQKILLNQKQQILDDLVYYEKKIDELRSGKQENSFNYDDDSSDTEEEYPMLMVEPSIKQLKMEQNSLKICLQATQELTSLQVLQSETCLMVEEPKIEGERQVKEEGSWKEVTADCKVDLVPFCMTFYCHIPNKKFGAKSYRSLSVSPVKPAQEKELASSILSTVSNPSDAVEVLKSYAEAYRSRRTTLAKLAEKYGDTLFMTPTEEGGFTLKCADLLEMCWTLQNTWSFVAPFHHKLKFDIEYMDESYIKIITQAHQQLLNPTITTDERTMHLSKIISTCLAVKGYTDQSQESMSSDVESVQNFRKRRTTFDHQQEEPEFVNKIKSKTKESREKEIMAPPKAIPKKAKRQNKDINSVNKNYNDNVTNKNRNEINKDNVIIENKKVVQNTVKPQPQKDNNEKKDSLNKQEKSLKRSNDNQIVGSQEKRMKKSLAAGVELQEKTNGDKNTNNSEKLVQNTDKNIASSKIKDKISNIKSNNKTNQKTTAAPISNNKGNTVTSDKTVNSSDKLTDKNPVKSVVNEKPAQKSKAVVKKNVTDKENTKLHNNDNKVITKENKNNNVPSKTKTVDLNQKKKNNNNLNQVDKKKNLVNVKKLNIDSKDKQIKSNKNEQSDLKQTNQISTNSKDVMNSDTTSNANLKISKIPLRVSNSSGNINSTTNSTDVDVRQNKNIPHKHQKLVALKNTNPLRMSPRKLPAKTKPTMNKLKKV